MSVVVFHGCCAEGTEGPVNGVMGYKLYCKDHSNLPEPPITIKIDSTTPFVDGVFEERVINDPMVDCAICGRVKTFVPEGVVEGATIACRLCSVTGKDMREIAVQKDEFLSSMNKAQQAYGALVKEMTTKISTFLQANFVEEIDTFTVTVNTTVYSTVPGDDPEQIVRGDRILYVKTREPQQQTVYDNQLPEDIIAEGDLVPDEEMWISDTDYIIKKTNIATDVSFSIKSIEKAAQDRVAVTPQQHAAIKKMFVRDPPDAVFVPSGDLIPYLENFKEFWDKVAITQAKIFEVLQKYGESF
jgi:hypothetical protein